MRRIGRMGLLLALVACAIPARAQQQPSDALARLQRGQAANPRSVAANRALGLWYFKNGRYQEARVALGQALQLDSRDGVSALYSGLAAEQMKDWSAAKASYNSYLSVGKTRGVRNDVRARLVVVTREEMKAAAKEAVANEAALTQQAPRPGTVAVLPFKMNVSDLSLMPLERGMAELVVTDLAKARVLTLLERDRMQAIADEIALGRTAQVDPATAARAGKLIQAERLVQGAIVQSGNTRNLSLTGGVVNTSTAAVTNAEGSNGDLDQLFNLEKRFVISVLRVMGVTLTAALLQEIDRRPTQSLQAFLAYSRGLQAEDDGRFDEAARFFDNARSIDPGFGAALVRAQQAAAAQQASTAKVESGIRASSEGSMIAAAERGSTSSGGDGLNTTLNTVVGDVNPTTTNSVATASATAPAPPAVRDAPAEKAGTDVPTVRTGQVTIVIRRP